MSFRTIAFCIATLSAWNSAPSRQPPSLNMRILNWYYTRYTIYPSVVVFTAGRFRTSFRRSLKYPNCFGRSTAIGSNNSSLGCIRSFACTYSYTSESLILTNTEPQSSSPTGGENRISLVGVTRLERLWKAKYSGVMSSVKFIWIGVDDLCYEIYTII